MKKIIKISENFFFILAKKRKLNLGIFFGGVVHRQGQLPAIERKLRTDKMRMFDTSIVPKPSHAN